MFETGKDFKSFQEAFLERAQELSESKWFQPVLRAAALNDQKQYMQQISKCHKDGKQLVETIAQHSLFECDRLKRTCLE